MKEITFATTNRGKYLSAKRALSKHNIKTLQADIELPESQNTLEDIAIQKAKFAFQSLKRPVIAMDAGFFIYSLSGFPMMYVKPVLQSIGIKGLLKLVKGKKRECEFREVLSFSDSLHSEPKIFTRVVKGILANSVQGEMSDKHWSELALVFIPENETKTMAAMSEKEHTAFRKKFEKNSHFEQFGKYYSSSK